MKIRGQLCSVGCLLLSCGSQGLNSGLSGLVASAFAHEPSSQHLDLIIFRFINFKLYVFVP